MVNIRAQYHFIERAEGLCAWDVRKLIELSRDFPVMPYKVAECPELESNHWYKHVVPTPASIIEHAELIRDADLSYPIILGADDRVMDGMHRICKAVMEGLSEIPAVRFVEDPEPDYVGKLPSELPYD